MESAKEGGFVVKCIELPVASQGVTKQEALKNIKEAILGYLDTFAYTRPIEQSDESPNS